MSGKEETKFNIDPQEMLTAGVHFGHRVSASHPKMKPFLFGARNTVQIIDLEKSAEKLQQALEFIQNLVKEGGILLFIGTKFQAKAIVQETAKACGLPYVSNRWLGGTFTNFETIRKRVNYLKGLEKQKAEGELEKYTKKERLRIEREMAALEARLGGVKDMEKLPEAIFVCDMKKDFTAVREAKAKGVKVVGLTDTNINPALADYPIPANDDAISSIRYILGKVQEAILKTKEKSA
jgi:small subunit ribosomal protein S2